MLIIVVPKMHDGVGIRELEKTRNAVGRLDYFSLTSPELFFLYDKLDYVEKVQSTWHVSLQHCRYFIRKNI